MIWNYLAGRMNVQVVLNKCPTFNQGSVSDQIWVKVILQIMHRQCKTLEHYQLKG